VCGKCERAKGAANSRKKVGPAPQGPDDDSVENDSAQKEVSPYSAVWDHRKDRFKVARDAAEVCRLFLNACPLLTRRVVSPQRKVASHSLNHARIRPIFQRVILKAIEYAH